MDDAHEGIAESKWVGKLQDRIKELTDLSVVRRKRGKDKTRDKLNQSRVERVLSEGSHVLMKVPGRCGAFQSSWEGPYTVEKALSKVNYRVMGQGLPPTGRVVHINNLKVYHERKVYRAVVAVEEEIDQQVLKGKSILTEEPCVGFSQAQLDEVLSEFKDTFSDTPGCCSTNQCHITLNSDAQPVNLPVRRIPFTMRDGVKAALDKMVDDGVIVKVDSTSWCSPIVPVTVLCECVLTTEL